MSVVIESQKQLYDDVDAWCQQAGAGAADAGALDWDGKPRHSPATRRRPRAGGVGPVGRCTRFEKPGDTAEVATATRHPQRGLPVWPLDVDRRARLQQAIR